MDIDLIAALIGWLDEDQVEYASNMLESGVDEGEVWEYLNRSLTKKEKVEILDRLASRFPDVEDNIDASVRYLDKYPPSIERDMEYKEYVDSLPKSDQEWIKQAYHEMYANGSYGIQEEDRILQTSSMLKEARRHNNARRDDAYTITQNTGHLKYLEDRYETGEIDEEDLTWEDLFKYKGYEPAVYKIYAEAEYEIDNKLLEVKIALTRFYMKMERLRKMNNRDMKTRRDRRSDEET